MAAFDTDWGAPDAAAPLENNTPDARVAQRIVERLAVQGLIAPEQSDDLLVRLAAGTLNSAGWSSVAQRALAAQRGQAGA